MINIRNIDNNEFFKLSIVRYINLAINHPTRVAKAHKDFAKKVNFKGIEFPIKMRDIHKIKKKKRIISALVFLAMKIRKTIQCMYQKNVVKKTMLSYY